MTYRVDMDSCRCCVNCNLVCFGLNAVYTYSLRSLYSEVAIHNIKHLLQ